MACRGGRGPRLIIWRDAVAVGRVCQLELRQQAAVVDKVVVGVLQTALIVEGDLGVRDELPHDVGDLAEADGSAAAVVDPRAGWSRRG